MFQSSERSRGPLTFYVHLTDRTVEVGEHAGSGHSDCATSVSHADFLAGEANELVRGHHGTEVLDLVGPRGGFRGHEPGG